MMHIYAFQSERASDLLKPYAEGITTVEVMVEAHISYGPDYDTPLGPSPSTWQLDYHRIRGCKTEDGQDLLDMYNEDASFKREVDFQMHIYFDGLFIKRGNPRYEEREYERAEDL